MSPAEVGVVTVEAREVELSDQFNGRVEAVHSVALRPRVSGYLSQVNYVEGALVEEGAVLFVIDRRPYRIALDRALAQLQQANSTTRLANIRIKRVERLVKSQAASVEELDNARAALEQGQAQSAAAEAAVAEARLNLDYAEVRAPISGRAGRALFTVGNLATADQSLLTTVVAQDPVYVYFDCDEQSYLRYNSGRDGKGGLAIGNNTVRVGMANEQGFPHVGTVDFLDNQLDPLTGTIRARVKLENTRGVFTPGLFARVQMVSGLAEQALMVDERAVLTDQDRHYLYVVSAENTAERRDVTAGRTIGDQRMIESGLQAGDRVIVEGTQKVFYPGIPVSPVPLSADSAVDAG